MKKHPVDDLFAQKLSDWEPKASPDLWQRIETRQHTPTHRLGSWYWFAAAGVSLALLSGYLVWRSESSKPENTENQMVRKEPKAIQKSNEFEPAALNEAAVLLAEENGKGPEKGTFGHNLPAGKEKKAVEKSKPIAPSLPRSIPVLNGVEVAAIDKEETTRVSLPINVDKNLLATQTIETPATVQGTEEASKTRVIVAHVQMDEANQEDQKSSKLLRILRQLKNAKQGDAVDWDEVGFNPKKLVARADERLRNEEEKFSKQYQNLKEKTKL